MAACCKRDSVDVDFVPGGLLDPMEPMPFQVNAAAFEAITAHLITRAYTGKASQEGQLYEVDEAKLRATPMTAYRAYREDSDDGGQRIRIDTTNGMGQSNYQDTSWVTVGGSELYSVCCTDIGRSDFSTPGRNECMSRNGDSVSCSSSSYGRKSCFWALSFRCTNPKTGSRA